MKDRLAIVVQRCREGVVGGSEALAWQWAVALSDVYAVEVLTTTATEYVLWANELPEGVELSENVAVRRFKVDIGRTPYWHVLHERLQASAKADTPAILDGRRWTMAWQEEFIRKQGPYSSDLMRYLRSEGRQYSAVIFVTYLYPTTYFGLQQTSGVPRLLVPTVHDEVPAYLPAYRQMATDTDLLLWNTAAEQRWGRQLWGAGPGLVVGMAIETELHGEPIGRSDPYVLYSGRIDWAKCCDQLLMYYGRFQRHYPGLVKLVLTGQDELKQGFGDGVEYLGYVTEEEKFRLMRGATVFCMPSPHESFSISSLEAMAQSAPLLATVQSDVLKDHVEASGGGMLYADYDEFERSLLRVVRNPSIRSELGARAREYVVGNYSRSAIQLRLLQAVESVVRLRRDRR